MEAPSLKQEAVLTPSLKQEAVLTPSFRVMRFQPLISLPAEHLIPSTKMLWQDEEELTREKIEEEQYKQIGEDMEKSGIPRPKGFDINSIVCKFKEIDRKAFKKEREEWLTLEMDIRLARRMLLISLRERNLIKTLANTWEFIKSKEKGLDLNEESGLDNYYFISRLFLNSDLPTDFLSSMSSSTLWVWAAHKCMSQQTKKFFSEISNLSEKKLSKKAFILGSRSKRLSMIGFFKLFMAYLKTMDEIEAKINNVEDGKRNLYFYIDLWNCDSIEDVRKMKKIKMEKLEDIALYERLNATLVESVEEIKDYLFKNHFSACKNLSFLPPESRKMMDELISVDILGVKEA
jgi:hypothetical protein